MSNSVNMLPEYSTKLFTEIWNNAADFLNDWNAAPFIEDYAMAILPPDRMNIIFYLLYARYGNNPIANLDENQFKYKIFSVIYQYGPTWAKRLDIQKTLRTLSEDDLLAGSKAIYNHAYNPSTAPSTQSLTELNYIDNQNTSNIRRGKLDAYALLWNLLKVDVTEDFLDKFKYCFKQFVRNEKPILFVTEIDEEEA